MKWIIDGKCAYSQPELDVQIVKFVLNRTAEAHDMLGEGTRIVIKGLARGLLYEEERKKPHFKEIYRPPHGVMATTHLFRVFGVMLLEVLQHGEISISTETKPDSDTAIISSIVLSKQDTRQSGGQMADRGSDGSRQNDLYQSSFEEFKQHLSYISHLHP